MLGNFFDFPDTVYQFFPIVTLLGSLGLLYRILYKTRQAEKERYRLKIDKLQQELEEYKKNVVNRKSED
ncbi:MAG: hypothetical protein ACLFSQ_10885 [Candidatus Zixiibacteriota bacterium]